MVILIRCVNVKKFIFMKNSTWTIDMWENYKTINRLEGEGKMNIREMVIRLLCNLGIAGVGKSLILGIYDIPVPSELKKLKNNE